MLLGLATGCLFPPEPQPDGADCEVDDDCESGSCLGSRFCAYSNCTNTSYCEAGFVCEEPPAWQEVVTLGLVKNRCVPDCTICPTDEPRWSCGDRCFFDSRPIVDPGGPYDAMVGHTVVLEGAVDLAPGREIDEVVWMEGAEVLGDELTVEVAIDGLVSPTFTLVVTDDDGSTGSQSVQVNVCSPLDGPCHAYGSGAGCCDPMHECRDDDEDGEPTCARPSM